MGRYRKKAAKDRLVGILLGTLGLLLVLGLGVLTWWLASEPPPDPVTNCPQNGPREIHVVLIDRSDPITSAQAQIIRQKMKRLKEDAAAGTRFDIYTIEGDLQHELAPVLSVCATSKPKDADIWTESRARVRALYEQRFEQRLDAELNAMLEAREEQSSPILESLRAAAQTSFGLLQDGELPLKLTLVSDLVQNSKSLSHFRSAPDFGSLEHTNLWTSLRPPLKGASVEILYLQRPTAIRSGSPIQNRGHQEFWARVISAGGGVIERFEPVVGDR